jgi:hypothetical protein
VSIGRNINPEKWLFGDAKGRNCAFARGGISETGSDIISNSGQKAK